MQSGTPTSLAERSPIARSRDISRPIGEEKSNHVTFAVVHVTSRAYVSTSSLTISSRWVSQWEPATGVTWFQPANHRAFWISRWHRAMHRGTPTSLAERSTISQSRVLGRPFTEIPEYRTYEQEKLYITITWAVQPANHGACWISRFQSSAVLGLSQVLIIRKS